jgi:hypothetical protein
VKRIIEAANLPEGVWLEPAVGDGVIVRTVNAMRPDVSWLTVDTREEVEADLHADFLLLPELKEKLPVAITNPPFSLALFFAQKMLTGADHVVLLARLNWLSGPRAPFLREHPCDVYVLPNRPSFVYGGSDATEYGWLVWGPERGGRWFLLADTPRAERRGVV